LRYLADKNSAHRQTDRRTHRQTDRHTPMITIPCGLRRAGKYWTGINTQSLKWKPNITRICIRSSVRPSTHYVTYTSWSTCEYMMKEFEKDLKRIAICGQHCRYADDADNITASARLQNTLGSYNRRWKMPSGNTKFW